MQRLPEPSGRRPSMRELPASERPRERLLADGPETLRDAELFSLWWEQ